MNKNKFTEKLKEGVSVREIEDFARQHTTEFFTIAAIVIATITSSFNFFLGGPKITLFFAALCAVGSILFPVPVDRWLKKFNNFIIKQEKSTQIVLGAVKIVVALFTPFLIFAVLGLMSGSSYHYYLRHAQIMNQNKPSKSTRDQESGEHD